MENNQKKEKIRVLWLSDSPTTATGFGSVARNILEILHNTGKYDFTVIGINHSDWYDRNKYPYKILEAAPALASDIRYKDLFGRQRLLDELGTGKYDILFTLQDTFIIEEIAEKIIATREQMKLSNIKTNTDRYKLFKWIFYYPIDAAPKENWITKSALLSDYPVCYTEYGKNLSDIYNNLKKPIKVIYHGINTKDFYSIENKGEVREFRKKYFKEKANGKCLIINISRNQPRKDLTRTLAIFDKLLDERPNSFLYLHCQANDVGGNLVEISRNFKNLKIGENWSIPNPKFFSANQGVSLQTLNFIYNSADIVLSTTWGEGWGLQYTEAMATKTLVIAPNNTSVPEILGTNDDRGLIYKCGSNSSEFISIYGDNERLRPLGNVDSAVEKIKWAIDNPTEVQTKIEAAYKWVINYQWSGDNVGNKWIELFNSAYSSYLRDKWITTQKIGRNEKCPCGSGKKFKFCHGK